MPQIRFPVGPTSAHVVDINITWWGQEEYFIDGSLVLRKWSFIGGKPREFRVGQHMVSIVLSSTGKKGFFGRVFVDGELYIDELFPQLVAMVSTSKQPGGYLWPVITGIAAAALAALWRWYTSNS